MQKKINSLLENIFAVNINRSYPPKPIPKLKNPGKNNLIVEFIGPPGVGKSTLCQYYLKNKKIDIQQKLITKKEIEQYKKGNDIILTGLHRDIFLNKTDLLRRPLTNKRFEYFAGYYDLLKTDYLLSELLQNRIGFFDQHIFQLSINLPKRLPQDKRTNILLENRIFISCYANIETIIRRVEKRNQHKFGQSITIREKIKTKTINNIHNHTNAIKNLKSKGANILEINAQEDMKENCKIIDYYLNNFKE